MSKTPEWIAPNLITFTGFLIVLAPTFYMFGSYGTTFYNEETMPIDRWVFLLWPVCYFVYRVLDEMDGKQARKTGNSSPLGLLFDHGCDSYVVIIVIMQLSKFF